jgi:hypothetical protein
MGYHINDRSTSLDDLQARLEATDLIPSHQLLLDGLTKKMGTLKKAGVKSVAELRTRLKSKKSLASLADGAGINPDYLVLLRRVVEGFFPKPQPLKVFDWLDKDTVVKLEQAGVKNTLQLYEAASSGINALAKKAGLKSKDLSELMALSDLSRVQWVSPTFARTLVAAGFTGAAEVSKVNPEALYEAVMRANENARFYKGKVGLRDIKRLIDAAKYVP